MWNVFPKIRGGLILWGWLIALPASAQFVTATNTFALFSNTFGSYLGNGASCADFDGDGFHDFSFATSDVGVVFYKNLNGQGSQAVDFQLDINGDVKQVLWVDFDNDGDQDLFITRYLAPCKLYRRDGMNTLVDISLEAGLPQETNWQSFGASFGDYDCDGGLDFYICNYNVAGNVTNHLFHNNLDGTFSDVTAASGTSNGVQNTFQSTWLDYNNDGRLDLYVINDRLQYPNALYLNNGDGTFTDVAPATNSDLYIYSMTITPGDFDNDLDEDIYVTNGTDGNSFLVNQNNSYDDQALDYGLTVNALCWAAQWLDYDNDGLQDLYVTTSTEFETGIPPALNFLFHQTENGFVAVTNNAVTTASHTHCNLRTDIDNDGFPDIVNHTSAAYASIYKSVPNGNNWLKVRLTGTISNSDAIGTQVIVYCGNQLFSRRLYCGESYLGQHSKELMFGIGQSQIDSLHVIWPSGLKEHHYNLSPNQTLTFTEGETLNLGFDMANITLCEGESIDLESENCENCLVTWNDSIAGSLINIAEPGDYHYEITLPHGATLWSDTLTVQMVYPQELIFDTTPASCVNSVNGELNIIGLMDFENLQINGLPGQLNMSDLPPGSYEVTYQYQGCTFESEFLITIEEPAEVNFQIDPISCYGDATTIEFMLSNESTIIDIFPTSFNSQEVFAGTYELTFIDEFGCTTELSLEVIEPTPLSLTSEITNPTLDLGGQIVLDIQGGTEPYFVQWIGPNGFTASVPLISELLEGTYTCIVQDSRGCLLGEFFNLILNETVEYELIKSLAYPNPTDSQVLIKVDHQSEISLYDSNGQLVDLEFVRNGDSIELNLESQSNGIYHLVISAKNRTETLPLLIFKH